MIFPAALQIVEQYPKKGAKVHIEARCTRKWIDQRVSRNTRPRWAAGLQPDLTMLDCRSGGGGAASGRMIFRRRFRFAPSSPAPRRAVAAGVGARNKAIWTTIFRSDREGAAASELGLPEPPQRFRAN